jgi:hypothetical protein
LGRVAKSPETRQQSGRHFPRHCIVLTKGMPNTFSGEPPRKRFILCVRLKHSGTALLAPSRPIANRGTQSSFPDSPRHNPVPIGTYASPARETRRIFWGETHASDIDGVGFGRRSESRLLSKCECRSGQRSSREACRGCRVNGARCAVLRASHPARHHQMLSRVRRGAPRLPPLLSLVEVATP